MSFFWKGFNILSIIKFFVCKVTKTQKKKLTTQFQKVTRNVSLYFILTQEEPLA